MKSLSTGSEELVIADQPEAAVAIIRCSEPADSVLLVRRNKSRRDPWSGHFAFPGGRRESQDADIYATCTRETYEEAGILLAAESLQRILPPTQAGRNVKAPILVQPYLFHLEVRPTVTVEQAEIDSYVWLEIDTFMKKHRHTTAEVFPERFYPVFPLKDYFLWGFSYKLLCSVLEIANN